MARSLFGTIVKNFIESLKPRKFWGELRGRDQNGIEYYEDPKTLRVGKRPSRWFVPPKGSDFQQELPVEWEAWLRHKRRLPPTEEEIQLNEIEKMTRIENARKLEEAKTRSKDEITVKKPAFPVYEEYSVNPDGNQIQGDKQKN